MCIFPALAYRMHTLSSFVHFAWHRTQPSRHVQRPHLPSGPPEEASEGTVEQLAITSSGAKGVEAKQHSRWRRHGVTSPPNSNGPSVSKLKQLHPSSRGSGAVKQAEVTPAEFQRKMLEGELQRLQFVADAPRVCSCQHTSLYPRHTSVQGQMCTAEPAKRLNLVIFSLLPSCLPNDRCACRSLHANCKRNQVNQHNFPLALSTPICPLLFKPALVPQTILQLILP